MVEKFLEISLLYDFYGCMLTDKQQQIIELYYNDDLSLGEISELINISRQGVYDLLKRSEKQLYHYEEKLKLVEKFNAQKEKIKEAYSVLDNMKYSSEIEKVKKLLNEVIHM